MRSVGNSVAMITNWLFVYVVVIMTPSGKGLISLKYIAIANLPTTAIENIAWRFYIIFAVLNFAWFPIVWIFYVETKGLSLEEVDLMFKIKYHAGKSMTYKEAAVLAKKEADSVRMEATRRDISINDDKQGIQHEEVLITEMKYRE
jgi:hypothetical protein